MITIQRYDICLIPQNKIHIIFQKNFRQTLGSLSGCAFLENVTARKQVPPQP